MVFYSTFELYPVRIIPPQHVAVISCWFAPQSERELLRIENVPFCPTLCKTCPILRGTEKSANFNSTGAWK